MLRETGPTGGLNIIGCTYRKKYSGPTGPTLSHLYPTLSEQSEKNISNKLDSSPKPHTSQSTHTSHLKQIHHQPNHRIRKYWNNNPDRCSKQDIGCFFAGLLISLWGDEPKATDYEPNHTH